MKAYKSYFTFCFLSIWSFSSLANQANDIVKEMKARDSGYKGYRAEIVMKIISSDKNEIERSLSVTGLEQNGDGDKIITYFSYPKDIAGTALLTYSHTLEPDEQWLYLPSIKRTKRISSNNQSGPFMGSEFAYEDMSSWEIDKYQYEFLGEGAEPFAHWKLKYTPQYKNSGYSELIVWVDKIFYQARKIEYYDRKGSLLKTLEFKDFNQYLNRYWRPNIAEMSNQQNGRKTILTWSSYQLGINLSDDEFLPAQLPLIRR